MDFLDWEGKGNPTVTFERIAFNGDHSLNHDHETFSIGKENVTIKFDDINLTIGKEAEFTAKVDGHDETLTYTINGAEGNKINIT